MALNVYALTAYYFHPTYENSKLLKSHKDKINEFLFKQLDNVGIEEWDKFNIRSGIFKILYDKNVSQPLVFWRMAETECPKLSCLVLKLLKIPAASAGIERLFSNWAYVHNLLRNRLTFNNSKKLLHIYFTLKEYSEESEEENYDDFFVPEGNDENL